MRVYTFTFTEEFPEDTVEETIAALNKGNLTVDDLQVIAADPGSGFTMTFDVVDVDK